MQYERCHELLELCFKAKEKGIDIFFDYAPHVEWITVQVYKGKWTKKSPEPHKIFRFGTDEKPAVLKVIAYINELLVEVENVNQNTR